MSHGSLDKMQGYLTIGEDGDRAWGVQRYRYSREFSSINSVTMGGRFYQNMFSADVGNYH